jgi:hypothetical protein
MVAIRLAEMKSPALLTLIAAITLTLLPSLTGAQTIADRNLDSMAKALNIEIAKLTSPQLEQRKRVRAAMQRSCYTHVLSEMLLDDGLSAIISFLKAKLNIEYSLSHRPLSILVRIERSGGKVWPITLPDDWTFPVDPWKKR